MASSGSTSITVTSWDTLKFSWETTSQSIPNNTSTISWKLQLVSGSSGRIDSTASKSWSVTVNGTKYSGTNTINIANNTTKTLASGTTTIAHNSNGTKAFSYSFSQEFSITFSGSSIGTKSGTGSGTLNTIPRASSLTVSNGTLGTAQSLTITRADSSFTHTITYKCGTASGTITTKTTSTSVSWTPSLSLATQNTTGASVSVVLTLTTYSGSTVIGTSSKTISCAIPTTVKPTVTLNVSDAMGYADTFGAYIQGKSKIKVVVTASGAQGSSIKSYKTTVDGNTYTTASVTTGIISSTGTLTITTTVTDSRGRTATTSKAISVVAYSPPSISEMTVHRCDSDGTPNKSGAHMIVRFGASVTALTGNTAEYTLKYKKTSDSEYTTVALSTYSGQYTVADGKYIFAAVTSSSYNVELAVLDYFNNTHKTGIGTSAYTLWSKLRKGLGFAFGKIAELEGVLDIGFKTRFMGGILQPTLEANTDFNDILIPNTYTLLNMTSAGYSNSPISSGTGSLTIEQCGEEGQLHQILKVCSKTNPIVYERFYHTTDGIWGWGEWLHTSMWGSKLLWSGAYYMNASQTITLAEAVSKQTSGIVLVFSRYSSSTAQNYHWNTHFVSKYQISEHDGNGHLFLMSSDGTFSLFASKYLYISDTTIKGNANNEVSGTGTCGITYTNGGFVLRYVIGV